MKKIVYFSHGLSANGIETFLVNVLEKLDKTKYEATVVIGIDEGVECLHEQRVLDMGVRVYRAGDLDSMKKKYEYIKNVKAFLKKEQFDTAHSNMDLLNGITLYLAKKAKIKKRICHAHNSKSQYNPTGSLVFLKKAVQKMYCLLMRKAILCYSTQLIACSEVASDYFYGKREAELIYNGIRTESFIMPESFDRNGYAQELGFKGDETHRLVSIGRLSMQKNPIFALEIISELKKIRNDFTYAWVGSGELENDVKAKVKEMNLEDEVILTGVRTDIPQILGCCDCFLMPSLFEGLPFSLVEAQAAGLKCVVSDVVTKTADIGLIEYISLEKSAKEWAEKINIVLDSPSREKDTEKAKLFDISNTVKQLEEIYDK
ncbi:MAG: glycosyltransferase [Clostridia bacterium]|nr:glycosyltransferase [Clostridia bacterium]